MSVAFFASCAEEDFPGGEPDNNPAGALLVKPSLYDTATTQTDDTRATTEDTDPDISQDDDVLSRDALRENYFATLDVFVKETEADETATWFKTYHIATGGNDVAGHRYTVDTERYLTADSQPTSLLDQAQQLLSLNWAADGYDPSKTYDIYVTANNPHTNAGSASLPSTLAQLKALTTTNARIYRYSVDAAIDDDSPLYSTNWMFSDDENEGRQKQFLMDGVVREWQVDLNSAQQVFDVDLKRAAAKIIVNVSFNDEDPTMLKKGEAADAVAETDEHGRNIYISLKDYLDYVGRVPGKPRFKYVNFAFQTADIADGDFAIDISDADALQTHSSNHEGIKQSGDEVDNVDDMFTFTTYSYPFAWGDNAQKIPYLLVSVFYTKDLGSGNSDQLRSYYRIPVCDESQVTSLERNNIYIVDAVISSLGSTNEELELKDEELRIEYHVIPWADSDISQEATTVRLRDTKYLMVTPTDYTLRGDGSQSVNLQYYASLSTVDGRYVDINDITVSYVNYQGTTTTITGTTVKQVETSAGNWVTATAANTDGTKNIRYTMTAPTTNANGEKVIITVTPSGLIIVESEALDNRAVKNIAFDVSLLESEIDEEHVTIRHFPMDNIQSIPGSWSTLNKGTEVIDSYHLGTVGVWDQPDPSWQYYAYGQDTGQMVNCSYSDYTAWQNAGLTATESTAQTVTLNNTQKTAIFGSTNDATNYGSHNSAATSVFYETDGYSYYVTRSGWYSYTYTYYRIRYQRSRIYYYEAIVDESHFELSWVDWERDAGVSTTSPKYTRDSDGHFYAKVYNESDGKIYAIAVTRSGNSSNYSYRYGRASSQSANSGNYYYAEGGTYDQINSNMTNLTNNHMYVIQLTSTSSTYAIGRPTLDANYQSNDKVVSPAFMIASQLGANTPFTSATEAAALCGNYMEVGTDGTRYTGWRLPTRDEVGFITKYQEDTKVAGKTMQAVMTGANYWTLEGKAVATGYGIAGGSNYYKDTSRDATSGNVRCIRDLTLSEVNKLNNAE